MQTGGNVPLGIRARSGLFDALFAVWTALFALGVPVFHVLGRPRRPIRAATRLWVRGALFLLKHVVGLTHVVERHHDQSEGPVLIVSNHQSPWETLAFLVLFPDMAIVAKQELLKVPVVSWYLAQSPMIIIDRASGSSALKLMLKQARTAIDEGRSVVIFPEGSRMSPDAPLTFQRGVELLYASLNVPVQPVVVNSGRFWSEGVPRKRPGRITVSLLPPVLPGLSPAAAAEQVRCAMETERNRINAACYLART